MLLLTPFFLYRSKISLNFSPSEIIFPVPLKRNPFRCIGSTTLISIDEFCLRFSIVCGERMSANAKCDSSIATIVPLGDQLGVLSAETVAAICAANLSLSP